MRTTDFARLLTEFLKTYLPGKRGLSENTIMSYRDTFRSMLRFAEEDYAVSPERLTINDITEEFIYHFMKWLSEKRGNSPSTKRQRLAAVHVFVNFLKTRQPENLLEYQKILDIRIRERNQQNIGYLTSDEMVAVLAAPDLSDRFGRRDMALLALMYDSAARVQEICDLTVGSLRLQKPPTVTITKGKGQKTRIVPLMPETARILEQYINENELNIPAAYSRPLFCNHRRGNLSRAGVTYILKKYCDMVRRTNPTLPDVSPHIFRHSKAMHMLKAGLDLIYIRDFLGHSQLATTEVYAKADSDMKRKAIESVSLNLAPDLPDWTDDMSLMQMLTEVCR